MSPQLSSEPRVWVGTMCSGEGDTELSKKSVADQVGVQITHYIISGLDEHTAAQRLYGTWESLKSAYDFFVQVDADTVLNDGLVIKTLYQTLRSQPSYTAIQAPLHDYMTDSHIMGLNGYLPAVRWIESADHLYTDRCHQGNVTLTTGLPGSLVPAGKHAWFSTPEQAYHYGVHRGLKGQWGRRDQVKAAWERGRDKNRALALIGFLHAGSGYYSGGTGFNYTDSQFRAGYQMALTSYTNLL